MSSPNLTQWLIVKGVRAAAKIGALCGNTEAQKADAEFSAIKLNIKLLDKVHKYAGLKQISHEKAAKELGVSLTPELLEKVRMYDPEHWHEYY